MMHRPLSSGCRSAFTAMPSARCRRRPNVPQHGNRRRCWPRCSKCDANNRRRCQNQSGLLSRRSEGLKKKLVPKGLRGNAQSLPPCSSMIERQMERPKPIPWDFVVKAIHYLYVDGLAQVTYCYPAGEPACGPEAAEPHVLPDRPVVDQAEVLVHHGQPGGAGLERADRQRERPARPP